MPQKNPEDWLDAVFCRQISEKETWYAHNQVQGILPHEFGSRDEAVAWVAKQGPYRAEIERWARVIHQDLWSRCDRDARHRNGLGFDELFASLNNAIRVHDALSRPAEGISAER